ncbi:uncharacterized protein NPIL_513791 [Nephila pilipes]|uniref:Uncharacterized protein n=1 Tax=Nephila pilipes TaxID=299642 RepID=A0A8X6U3C4_NEPPI|nr:uncharacterized protein NPIL_513791 [Nephila pilipes]
MAFRRLKLGLMRCCIMMILFAMATSTPQNNNQDSILTNAARELNGHRAKRDLAHLKELERLLISVETQLDDYGITEEKEATCQLQATCEIYKRNKNTRNSDASQKNFIKLVDQMRREIQNPRIEPIPKYVFQYYEEAAKRGEQQEDCNKMYPKCSESMDSIFKG